MSWCGCEDYPCCGHDAGLGPEDARDWLENLEQNDPEGYEFALRAMKPCKACGEMRPNNDPAMRYEGICHMCQEDPIRQNSPVAEKNLLFHERKNLRKIGKLERLLKENGIELPDDDEDIID